MGARGVDKTRSQRKKKKAGGLATNSDEKETARSPSQKTQRKKRAKEGIGGIDDVDDGCSTADSSLPIPPIRDRKTLLTALLSLSLIFVCLRLRSKNNHPPASAHSTPPRSSSQIAAAGDCAADANADEDDADDVDSLFYAWSTDPPPSEGSLMRALFPNLTELQSAWEVHPLLSRVSFDPPPPRQDDRIEEEEEEKVPPSPPDSDRIPVIFHDRTLASKLKLDGRENEESSGGSGSGGGDPLLSMFSVDDVPTLLSHPGLDHGSDYRLLKKIILPPEHPTEAGEEYNGMLPKPSYTVEEAFNAFHYGAFSLVVNEMQQRWRAVSAVAAMMEEEFGAMGLGVNMYLTPEVAMEEEDVRRHGEVRQGFEAHWDWMDVIVMQLSGRKRWSVASESSVYLSNKDQKRKPSRKERESLRHYSDFTLCPGDVLYIPRGHMHNASTVVFENFDNANDDEGGSSRSGGTAEEDLDGCPTNYPDTDGSSVSAAAKLLADRLDGPSLHVTFGLLQSTTGTVESLLHHALDFYFARGGLDERVAIPANAPCPDPSGTAAIHDVEWRSVFHFLLAEVSRRDHPCDRLSDAAAAERLERCDVGTSVLRRSVPSTLFLDAGNDDRRITGEADVPRGGGRRGQYSNLKRTYLRALEIFVSSASVAETVDFVSRLLHSPPEDEALRFYYPGIGEKDWVLCPVLLKSLSDETFRRLLRSFRRFAEDHFHEALRDLNVWGEGKRKATRRQQQSDLKMVGQ